MSKNNTVNSPSELYFNGTEAKDLNLSEVNGKNVINSDEKGTKDTFISWLEYNEYVEYFEYSDFENLQSIGKGSYGSVFRANRKNSDQVFALKSFNNDETTLYQIINELKLHRTLDLHENILRFWGVTKIETDIVYQMNKYVLVLEYADSGTLNNYLKKHFNELKWNDKLSLASQLASSVSWLHENNVIHRDLHANNILIHKKRIKLADFGLSKKIAESSNTSKILGVVPYIDPKSFMNESYRLNMRSDVYSVGVLLWQISSGHEPFKDKGFDYDLRLVISINNGLRETSVDGTPIEYVRLYSACWKHEPDERPDMKQVASTLKVLSFKTKDIIVYNVNNKRITNYSLENVNYELNINNNNTSLISLNTLNVGENESFIMEHDYLTSHVVDKLIDYIIKKHDLGITFEQIQQLISRQTLKTSDNFIVWLSKNQTKTQYIWFLGLFYYYNIDTDDTEENSSNAFKLFTIASDENFPLAQIYLGKCYYDGYDTKQNKYKAFIYYQKSVENGSILGQFYLGYCYEFGIGTKINERKSIDWYQKAANNGNTTAKLYLASCYRFGKGVEKNEIQAFKHYKALAKQKIADAQQLLGNCLYNGIGTEVDKEQAFYWYKKAITNGNIIAKEIIKKYYKHYDIRTKKNNNTKMINLYIILFCKSLSQLRLYCIGKLLLITNFKKAFNYFQKAADKGNKLAQYILGNFYKNGNYVRKNVRKAFELYYKSAKQGYKYAQFQLGYYYDYGIGIDINKVKAFELYKLAAEKGHKVAQNNLGMLYLKGEGTEKNPKIAVYWFQKAAKDGESFAQNNLGLCYELGIGVIKNEAKAFEFYKKSAANGNINAKFQLGYCYVKGFGTEINRDKGFELYYEAAGKKGNYTQIIDNEKSNDLDKIHDWYKSAENDDKQALYYLGLCYEFGQGIYQDEIRAFEFYKKSAHQGYAEAQYKLGYFYDHGIGVDVNKATAFELYKLAAEKGNLEAQKLLQDEEIKKI